VLAEDAQIAEYPLKIAAGAVQTVPVGEMFEGTKP
jgi:hypothetical protein